MCIQTDRKASKQASKETKRQRSKQTGRLTNKQRSKLVSVMDTRYVVCHSSKPSHSRRSMPVDLLNEENQPPR